MKTSNMIIAGTIAFVVVVSTVLVVAFVSKASRLADVTYSDPVTEEYTLPTFHTLVVTGNMAVTYIVTDSAPRLEATAPSELLQSLACESSRGTARLTMGVLHNKRVICRMYGPRLRSLETYAGSRFTCADTLLVSEVVSMSASAGSRVEAVAQARELTAKTGSGASIELQGDSQDIRLEAAAGSRIDARRLESATAEVDATSGSAVYTRTAVLRPRAASGASIHYNHDARLESVQTSSGGHLSAYGGR